MNSPLTHTTFIDLKRKFLKALDNFNASDLSGTNSSGEVAGICLNFALHTIYDLIKDSKYLKALPSTKLVSTAGVEFINLDIEPDLDEIEAITDTTNNFKLIKKDWYWYRHNYPDPSESTGTPVYYIPRFNNLHNRIYLAPRPTAAETYVTDFIKNEKDLDKDGDISLLPTHYDYWIIAEAMVEWGKMEDPGAIPVAIISERDDKRAIAMNAIMSKFDYVPQADSHYDDEDMVGAYDYQRPVAGG